MICFIVELVLASIAQEGYFLGFFFWLDLVSTISMIPDCGWIWDPITGGGSTAATDLTGTARASRITRVIRVIRLIRLIRIVKLYKQAKLAQEKAKKMQHKKMVKKKIMSINKQRRNSQTGSHSGRIHPEEEKDDNKDLLPNSQSREHPENSINQDHLNVQQPSPAP